MIRLTLLLARAPLLCFLLAAASAAGSIAEEARGTIPFAEIRAGMRGTGRTVFSGSKIETFDVEVIGTMTNIAPKKNLILARLSGGPLAQTGILEGMSGSPVYFDGRLAGAVAYSWGFAKEPVCGITPIEEMLDLLSRNAPSGTASAPARIGVPASPGLLARPADLSAFLRERLLSMAGGPALGGMAPARLPVLLGGGSAGGAAAKELGRWTEAFASMGFSPMRAGGAGGEAGPRDETPLEAGSAVGVQIVRGDVEMAAIGTVTYARGDDILAFGHPFFGLGPTSLPMTRAYVHGVFPSLETSFKLAAATSPAGVVTQDRFPGLAGRAKGETPMVPVKLTISSGTDRSETYDFEVVSDPLITPIFFYLSTLQILSASEKDVGDTTLAIRKGSQIRIDGGRKIAIENLYSGDQSEIIASATVAYMTYLLMNNSDRPARVEGIDLDVGYSDTRRLARIDRAWADRYIVAPGETLPLHVSILPYRGDPIVVTMPLEIPKEAPEGKAILQVGDALTLSRMEFEAGGASFHPFTLDQLIFLLNKMRTNNTIYATVIRPDNGAMVGGERLPGLPPSIASVLFPPQQQGSGSGRVRLRGLLEEGRETDFAVRGYQKAIIEIRR